jgi:hypothetical protein
MEQATSDAARGRTGTLQSAVALTLEQKTHGAVAWV